MYRKNIIFCVKIKRCIIVKYFCCNINLLYIYLMFSELIKKRKGRKWKLIRGKKGTY